MNNHVLDISLKNLDGKISVLMYYMDHGPCTCNLDGKAITINVNECKLSEDHAFNIPWFCIERFPFTQSTMQYKLQM